MRNTLETRLGMFVGLALIAAFVILETVGGLELFKPGYRVSALFDTVHELTAGAPVKMAGVPIGRVKAIGFATNKVIVTMKLNRDAVVKTDSQATVKFTGLMGQNFVAIGFGTETAPRALDGTILTAGEQPDFSTLMAKLENVADGVDRLTSSFTGVKIDKILGPLMGFMEDNRAPLTTTISNLAAVSTEIKAQIASGQGTVGKLLKDDALHNTALATISNLNQTVSTTSDELRQTVADARKIVNQINAGEGTVGKLVKDDSLYRETTNSMTNIREILQKVNQGQGTVGKIINDPALYKNANFTLQKVDKATESLEDQGVLSVLGIVVGKLF
jgi:phospholipid/cholesterol/gamma-HCH transport system substrate-binding protein